MLVNQIELLQKENLELKVQIKGLKQYEKVLLSCDLLKCRVCENNYSFGQFKNHLLTCNKPIEFDVSYEIDQENLEVVFVIEVSKGSYSWKTSKSSKHIYSYLKSLKREEAGVFGKGDEEIEEAEKKRVVLSEILNVSVC